MESQFGDSGATPASLRVPVCELEGLGGRSIAGKKLQAKDGGGHEAEDEYDEG